MKNNMKLIMENWRKCLKESLAKQLTDTMHEKWREGFVASKGAAASRFKPVPLLGAEAPGEALERLRGYEKLEIIDGTLQQDINQPAELIVPELAHKLNGAPAVDYASAVEATKIISSDDIERLASEFHEVWMKHNDWQRENNPGLFLPYESLPSDEKRKDLVQLKVALDLKYGDDQQIQQYFNEVYEKS
jgi:hypothetical protein